MPYDRAMPCGLQAEKRNKINTDWRPLRLLKIRVIRHRRGVASPQTGSYGTASSASHIALPCQWLTTQKNVGPWRELAARPASAPSDEKQQMPAVGRR